MSEQAREAAKFFSEKPGLAEGHRPIVDLYECIATLAFKIDRLEKIEAKRAKGKP